MVLQSLRSWIDRWTRRNMIDIIMGNVIMIPISASLWSCLFCCYCLRLFFGLVLVIIIMSCVLCLSYLCVFFFSFYLVFFYSTMFPRCMAHRWVCVVHHTGLLHTLTHFQVRLKKTGFRATRILGVYKYMVEYIRERVPTPAHVCAVLVVVVVHVGALRL